MEQLAEANRSGSREFLWQVRHMNLTAAVEGKEYIVQRIVTDDEELDAYRGVPGDGYTSEQVEQFRDVLYTMKEVEVAGWVRSLQLRAVELPDELKDEVFLIVGERRMH